MPESGILKLALMIMILIDIGVVVFLNRYSFNNHMGI